jgi:hypothetical protein
MNTSTSLRIGSITAAALFVLQVYSAADAAEGDDATPRLPGGRVDLNGTWGAVPGANPQTVDLGDGGICIYGCGPAADRAPPDRPAYKPGYQATVADLEARQVDEDPSLTCQPPGVPRIGPPDKIMQNDNEVVFLYDDLNGSFWRIVPTDGTPHRDSQPSYLGDAIGWWEDDTLVVETINFNSLTWLTDDGAFHTEDLRVIERLSREGDTLHYQAIAYDAEVLAEPWQLRPRELPLSDWELEEPAPCLELSLDEMVDRSVHHDNVR